VVGGRGLKWPGQWLFPNGLHVSFIQQHSQKTWHVPGLSQTLEPGVWGTGPGNGVSIRPSGVHRNPEEPFGPLCMQTPCPPSALPAQ
jgi:hypothetical protein